MTATGGRFGTPSSARNLPRVKLSPEEELELIRRHQAGDVEATSRMLEANQRGAVMIVYRDYVGRTRSPQQVEELIQESYLGLLRALDRFDVDSGWRFLTYASWWVRSFSERYLQFNNNDGVRVAPTALEKVGGAMRKAAKEDPDYDRDALRKRLVDETEMKERTVRGAMYWIETSVLSLDQPTDPSAETPRTLLERTPSEWGNPDEVFDALRLGEVREALREAMMWLPPRERDVLQRRNMEETLEDIGDDLGLTRERVRQLENKAIETIRRRILQGADDPIEVLRDAGCDVSGNGGTMGDVKGPTTYRGKEEIEAFVRNRVEEDPEVFLDPDPLTEEIEAKSPGTRDVSTKVSATLAKLREEWTVRGKIGERTRHLKRRMHRNLLDRSVRSGSASPTYRMLDDLSKMVFGSGYEPAHISEDREAICAELGVDRKSVVRPSACATPSPPKVPPVPGVAQGSSSVGVLQAVKGVDAERYAAMREVLRACKAADIKPQASVRAFFRKLGFDVDATRMPPTSAPVQVLAEVQLRGAVPVADVREALRGATHVVLR